MKLSTRYQAKGIVRIIRGTAKEIAGNISSNSTLGFKGRFERLAGKVQWKIGKAQGFCGL
jgi:uncharacterized protein YjbJ (UPF0337 family)